MYELPAGAAQGTLCFECEGKENLMDGPQL